jgi:archaellum component FlaD/FlaE
MNIEINEYKNYNPEEILNLYNSVGWCSYTNRPEMFEHSPEMFRAQNAAFFPIPKSDVKVL